MKAKQKNIIILSLIFLFFSAVGIAQRKGAFKDPNFIITPSKPIKLEKELTVFNDSIPNAKYMITIAADVPQNKKPMKVAREFEPGHVFLILQKITSTDTIHKVFGFYPLHVAYSLLKKDVRSQIKDNSKRDYDVEYKKSVTEQQFKTALNLALEYSKKKYHLNNFNCYDYVLTIFNAACNDSLPFIRVRYPLFFGKGGSPCSFYKYMKLQKDSATSLSQYILFGRLVAPTSTKYKQAF